MRDRVILRRVSVVFPTRPHGPEDFGCSIILDDPDRPGTGHHGNGPSVGEAFQVAWDVLRDYDPEEES